MEQEKTLLHFVEDALMVCLVGLAWLVPMLRIDPAATITWSPLILAIGIVPTVVLGLRLSIWFRQFMGDDQEVVHQEHIVRMDDYTSRKSPVR